MPDARDVEKTLRTEKPCEIWGWRAHPKLWNPNSGLPFLQQCLGGILVGPCLELVPYSCRRPREPWTLGTQDLGDNLLSPRPLDLFPSVQCWNSAECSTCHHHMDGKTVSRTKRVMEMVSSTPSTSICPLLGHSPITPKCDRFSPL